MKAENFAKLILQNCLTKGGTIKVFDFEMLFLISCYPKMIRRPFKWLSNGKSFRDTYLKDISLLYKLGIDYIHGNDAPRRGRNGDFIILSIKGLNRIKPYCKEVDKIIERKYKKNRISISKEELFEIIKEIAKINV